MQCLLCCEKETFIGLGICGHQPFCYKCVYKLHVVTKDHSCPICKQHLQTLVITSRENKTFNDIKKQKLLKSPNFQNILFDGDAAKQAFDKLTEYRCFVPKCDESKGFPSIAFLKKHLKEKHSRYLCDICVQNKRCVLQQHKLYSFKALENHQKHGDFDQYGNLIFLHPYCSFCKEYFFDEQGLKRHLGKQHYCCNTCPDTYKYTFYKDYKSLEIHFKMTHFLCPEADCIAKGFIVFKTNSDLMAHKYVQHQKNNSGEKKTKDLTAIAGFYTDSAKQEDSKVKFHDKEGVNFQDQYLSLKKMKHRGFHHVEEQEDGQLDLRIFYKKNIDQDELYQIAFDGSNKRDAKTSKGGKKQYRQRSQKIEKNQNQKKDQKDTLLEDLNLVRTTHMPAIEYSSFEKKITQIFSQDDYQKFSELRHGYNKKKISAKEFLEGYLKLFSNKRTAFNVWGQYIRTIQNQAAKEELDHVYLNKIKELPKNMTNIVNSSSKYSDFMKKLTSLIEENICQRIQNGSMNIKKKIKIDKARIFQMIQILRHMRTIDMVKLKFAANFSILPQTIHFIEDKIFMGPIDKIQEQLHKLPESEFLNLYLYIKFCRDTLSGKQIHLEKQFIKEQILEGFLQSKPQLEMKYGKRKQSMTLEQQAEYEQAQQKKKMQKLQQKTFTKKNVLIDGSDKYQFPDLVETKKEEEKKVFDPKANISNEEYKQAIVYETKKPATRQKHINQYFPSIGQTAKQVKTTVQTKTEVITSQAPQEKPWWDKVSGKVQEKIEEGKIQGEIGRKKKRGRQVIQIQGGFR